MERKDYGSELGAGVSGVSYDEWRAAVEQESGGVPLDKRFATSMEEGFRLAPLYTRQDLPPEIDGRELPGRAPFLRGRLLPDTPERFRVVSLLRVPAPSEFAAALVREQRGGADGALVRFAQTVRQGAVGATDGLLVATVDDLAAALADVPLDTFPLHLDAGGHGLVAAGLLVAVAEARGVSPEKLRGAVGCDPLGALARDGRLPTDHDGCFAGAAALVRFAQERTPGLSCLSLSTTVYHEAGAHAVQELALLLASGAELLRRLVVHGLSVDDICGTLNVVMSAGRHVFPEIAKLRAARVVWARLIEAAGGGETARALRLRVEGGLRGKTAEAPWLNLLRGTTDAFIAAVGGAEWVTLLPLDAARGQGKNGAFGRRLARNTPLVLREEASLARVADPAGGSYYIESLTWELARRAWDAFRAIEGRGGLVAALADGSIAGEIEATAEARRKAVAQRKLPITGVSEFPLLDEQPLPENGGAGPESIREAPVVARDAARVAVQLATVEATHTAAEPALVEAVAAAFASGATVAEVTDALRGGRMPAHVTPLAARRDAAEFEALRGRGDGYRARTGARPRVLLANIGPIPVHKARAGFAEVFLEAGGFEPVRNDGFDPDDLAAALAEYDAAGAVGAVICSSDDVYPAVVPALARGLVARGARFVALAGRPGEQESAYRAAGVDTFLFLGCDAVGLLESLWKTVPGEENR